MAAAPKDGHLYGFDLATNSLLYRVHSKPTSSQDICRLTPAVPPTWPPEKIRSPRGASRPLSPAGDTDRSPMQAPPHPSPWLASRRKSRQRAAGGAEWNSPAYDLQTNLILIGDVDWCTTVALQTEQEILTSPSPAQPWMGEAAFNPFNALGKQARADGYWSGWIHAVDADTGVWKWRLKSNYPIVGAVTPTAGGIVFFGDVGGNFYVLDAVSGERLWGQKIGGAIGGSVIRAWI
jgi:alcohol dehydrogenase (cytochrome c)